MQNKYFIVLIFLEISLCVIIQTFINLLDGFSMNVNTSTTFD